MKIGDYVRNKYGIAKVIDIENNNGIDILVFDKPICFLVSKETSEIKDDRLLNRLAIIDGVDVSKIKSSPNIIDLIEVGDYVNGYKVDDVYADGVYIEIPFIDHECIGCNENLIRPNEIKSIVTKEQFSQMEYKVGE